VGASLGLSAKAVWQIGKRYLDGGLERALLDAPRPGKTPALDQQQQQRIIAVVCSPPPEGRARWTVRLLTEEVINRKLVPKVGKGANVSSAVKVLEDNGTAIGLGQLFYGPSLWLNYGFGGWGPGNDPRTPDIIVTPNAGVTYSSSTGMIEDHGGFSHDDTNVMLLVENPSFSPQTIFAGTTTTQVAPTILAALGLNPSSLDAVRAEGTPVLPEVEAQLASSPQ